MKRSIKNGLIIILVFIGFAGFVRFGSEKNAYLKSALVQEPSQNFTPDLVQSKFESSTNFKLSDPSRVESGRLIAAIDNGQKLRLKILDRDPLDFAFRNFSLLTQEYKTTIGDNELLNSPARVFEGLAIDQTGEVHRASLVFVGTSLAGTVRMANGSLIELLGDEGQTIFALNREPSQEELLCVNDPRKRESRTMSLNPEMILPDWSLATTALLKPVEEPTMLASSGIDPLTGTQTLALNAPANPPLYEASLKVATTIVVLDKSATGINSKNNLTKITSQYLALMANVAAIYENQLGIRLLVQEIILTPDTPDYEDIPFEDNGETLEEFASWIRLWRPESTFGQSAAIKFGAGLSGGTLGIAYLNSIHTRNGVGVLKEGFGWALPSHEIGHMFGADHSLGGVMNAQYNNSSRSFFKDIEGQQITAAKQIHDRSRNKLSGPAVMRNPEEIPFAKDDVIWCAMGDEIRSAVLSNDAKQVYRGEENILVLAEVGQVTPRYAGSVYVEDEFVVFRPSSDFKGTAWFSYSVQGDVGRGWLHKGDVAVVVGDLSSDVYEIDLAAGQSKTLKLPGDGIISQLKPPEQAAIHESSSDSAVYIIRVNADASGTDSIQYRSGNRRQTINISYTDYYPIAEPDYFNLSAGETLNFNPMVNDWAVGLKGAYKTDPILAVGTNGEGRISQALLPSGFRLISARSKASRLGSLIIHRSPVVRDGRRRNEPNGLLSFKAKDKATGLGTIEYIIEDAIGQRSTGYIKINITGEKNTFIDSRNYAKGWVPTNDQYDKNWTEIEFNDAGWKRGLSGAGYERSFGYQSLISSMLNFRTTMYNKNESLYLRYAFDVDKLVEVDKLMLRIKFDDGFIAYLNGKRVASANAPINAKWNSGATELHNDQLALEFKTFDISSHKKHLREGKNVLSIHGLNFGLTSSDMLILPELVYSIEEVSRLIAPFCDPPSEQTDESIMLKGRLINNSQDVDVYFVWGKTDGGANKTSWDYQVQIEPNFSGECNYLVTGLPAGEVLFYRLYVTGKLGLIWSEDTQKSSTLNKGSILARPDFYNISTGGELRLINLEEGVLGNDVGITFDSNPVLLKQPSYGNLNFNSNGSFTYFPNEGFIGEDYFLYRLDGGSSLHNFGSSKKTVVSVGGDWRYYDKSTAPNRNWLKNSFDDSDWSRGQGLLGYGNGNEFTEISFGTNPDRKNVTAYFRQVFDIVDKELIGKVVFKLLRDDAAAIYLNGKEVYRDKNLSKNARHTTLASSSIVNETDYAIFEVDGNNFSEGENIIAAEVHQASRSSSDLSFALFGQAHLIPGNRVTIRVDSIKNNAFILNYNVTESQIEVNFDSEIGKSYILESSSDLINWIEIKAIDGNGGKVKLINKIDFFEQNRFFRMKI